MLTADAAVSARRVSPATTRTLVLATAALRIGDLLHLLVAQAHVLVFPDGFLRQVRKDPPAFLVPKPAKPLVHGLEHVVLHLRVARRIIWVEERLCAFGEGSAVDQIRKEAAYL